MLANFMTPVSRILTLALLLAVAPQGGAQAAPGGPVQPGNVAEQAAGLLTDWSGLVSGNAVQVVDVVASTLLGGALGAAAFCSGAGMAAGLVWAAGSLTSYCGLQIVRHLSRTPPAPATSTPDPAGAPVSVEASPVIPVRLLGVLSPGEAR